MLNPVAFLREPQFNSWKCTNFAISYLCLQVVIQVALTAAQSLPQDIESIQMHGTGTPLGDPIEIGGLAAIFPASGSLASSLVSSPVQPTALMASKASNGAPRHIYVLQYIH